MTKPSSVHQRHAKKPSPGKKKSSRRQTFGTTPAAQDRMITRVTKSLFNRFQTIRALGTPAVPFPSVLRTVVTIDQIGSLAAGTATADYLVNLNSVFIPFSTGSNLPNPLSAVGSLAPSGYGTYWSATGPYSAYIVIGSAISVELLTANAGDNLVYTVVPTGSSGAIYSDAVHAGQGAFAKSRLIGFGNGGRSVLSQSASVAELAGVSHQEIIDNPSFGAAYNATPSNRLFWQIWFATCDGANTAGTLTYRVQVSYDVMAILPTWTLARDDDVKTSMSSSSLKAILSAKEDCARAVSSRAIAPALQAECQSSFQQKVTKPTLQRVQSTFIK
jgi:hypothetical protein